MNTDNTLEKEIQNYLPHLSIKQKKTVLTVVKTFAQEQNDWWNEIGDEQQMAIDKSLQEMNDGNLTGHEEVMKKYKKWLNSDRNCTLDGKR